METHMLESLLLLTACFLELLIRQYHHGVIDYITLKECSILKISFIHDNKCHITQTKQRDYVERVLQETEKVIALSS